MRCNFIEVTHRHGCSPVNLQHIFRAPFLKSDSHLPKKLICFNDIPSKMMKNTFFFILKVLFVLKIFTYLSRLFGMQKKNGLIRKIKLISKLMTSQHGQQKTTIRILLNISQIKGNHTMKFGQLIEHPKRNLFL